MDHSATAADLRLRGLSAITKGKHEMGCRRLEDARALFHVSDRNWEAQTLLDLANAHKARGDRRASHDTAMACRRLALQVKDPVRLYLADQLLAELTSVSGDQQKAAA